MIDIEDSEELKQICSKNMDAHIDKLGVGLYQRTPKNCKSEGWAYT